MTFHCLFEQSGTFKNELKKLGYDALDYDIRNDFNQTDYVMDLFAEIERAYNKQESLFDRFKQDDVILAFFPCIMFSEQQHINYRGENSGMKNWSLVEKVEYNIKQHKQLNYFYTLISQLVCVCLWNDLKLVIENPYSTQHYLTKYWCVKPKVIDTDRSEHGDYYKKPTQYWFINFEPKQNYLLLEPQEVYIGLKKVSYESKVNRSMISPQYAKWFIRSYLIDE